MGANMVKKKKDKVTLVEHPEPVATKIVMAKTDYLPDKTIVTSRHLEVQGHTLQETEKAFNRLKKEMK